MQTEPCSQKLVDGAAQVIRFGMLGGMGISSKFRSRYAHISMAFENKEIELAAMRDGFCSYMQFNPTARCLARR